MNNFEFYFNPLFPYWFAALLIPAFAFFIWKEVKRNQRFLWSRIVAQLVILISILGLILGPGYIREKKSSSIMLLTPGYNRIQVDSLLGVYPDLRVVRLNTVDYNRESEILASFFDLPSLNHELAFVLGDGLPIFALELMTNRHFQYLPSSPPLGITQLLLPTKATANQAASIRGLINVENKTWLSLVGAGGREDSVMVNGSNSAFDLTFLPKQPGLFTYSLQYKDQNGMRNEPIPVEVFEEQKLNILFLQESPTFELRQLKNFLAERGHRLSLRYQMSKNNYRVEFANTPTTRISPLTSSILQRYDLVILNNDALESLSTSEKALLETSVRNGLGLILILNRTAEKDPLRERYFPFEMKKTLKDTVQLTRSSKQYTLPVIPLQIMETPSALPVIKNKSRILSAYGYTGFGKVGVQFLQETYRLALEGNSTDYASIWSPLLEKTARTKREKFKIQLTNSFSSYPDEPLTIHIISAVDEHPVLKDEQTPLPLLEHATVDNLWIGNTWAGSPGWHRLFVQDATLNYYVSEPSTLKSLRCTQQQAENTKASIKSGSKSSLHVTHQSKLVSPFVYFLLFILAAGYLWLAPKL